jgi:hypothetical protein
MSDQKEVKDKDLNIVDQHVFALMEHFDTVQIFCTRHDGREGTVSCRSGAGDWYARYGHISLWVKDQDIAGCPEEDEEEDEHV